MAQLTAFCRSVFLGSVNILLGAALAQAADGPAAELGLPTPRAGQSVGLAKMTLNGKPFAFQQVVAYETVKYGNPSLALLFSDQPIAVDELKATLLKNRGDDGDFGEFKTHLQLYCSPQGKPQNCSFWKDNWSVSISGADWTGDLAVKDGRVRGKVTLESGDKPDTRKSFDVRVDAQIVTVQLPPDVTAARKQSAEPAAPEPKKPLSGLAAKNLPMPADAAEVEYKEIVGQISYKSRSNVAAVAAFLAKRLAAQGWTSEDDSDLITAASAILARKRGDAELTIFIKPAPGGSTVQMMTDGLQW